MLRTQTLVEKLGKEYEPMIGQIKIMEFTKCVAQVANLEINEVPDSVIEEYLTLWAKNKFHLFKMLGNRTRVDLPFHYVEEGKNKKQELRSLGNDYPAFYPWLYYCAYNEDNKIDTSKWNWRDEIWTFLNEIVDNTDSVNNMSITTFFKRTLKAPDDLVTKIGRVYENEEIDATFTISIDPMDMMLASENPYKWTSCYRLESIDFSDSHADGCLAAVLDKQSLITYVWNNKGKFTLYNKYDLKEIRYYRMRAWIALSETYTSIHFNEIYPGKSGYSVELHKLYRKVVEDFIAKNVFPDKENIWCKPKEVQRFDHYFKDRVYDDYGYSEYDFDSIYCLKGVPEEEIRPIEVYTEGITCPCGCGRWLPGTGNDSYNFQGDGMIYENFANEHYCEYIDDYCSCDEDECESCAAWCRGNAVCELDEDEECDDTYDAEDEGCFDPDRSRIVHCGDHCNGCPLYKLHHPEEEESEDEEEEESEININDGLTTIGDAISTVATAPTPEIVGYENIQETLLTLPRDNREKYKIYINEATRRHLNRLTNMPDLTASHLISWCGIPIEIDNNMPNDYINLYKSINIGDFMVVDKIMKL